MPQRGNSVLKSRNAPSWSDRTASTTGEIIVSKLVPIQIDSNTVLYIEAQDDTETLLPAPPSDEEPEQRRGGAKGLGDVKLPSLRPPSPVQSMQMVQSTIRTYTLYCLS